MFRDKCRKKVLRILCDWVSFKKFMEEKKKTVLKNFLSRIETKDFMEILHESGVKDGQYVAVPRFHVPYLPHLLN